MYITVIYQRHSHVLVCYKVGGRRMRQNMLIALSANAHWQYELYYFLCIYFHYIPWQVQVSYFIA